MTRQDAKKEFWENTFKKLFPNMNDYNVVLKMSYHGSEVDKFIDKIYDSIEVAVNENENIIPLEVVYEYQYYVSHWMGDPKFNKHVSKYMTDDEFYKMPRSKSESWAKIEESKQERK